MNALEKIQRTFVRDEAYELLRDWIVEGKLKPGEKLKDKELAEQLGISRTPVREALLRLETEGLVLTKANSSTQVSPLDFHDAAHLYSIVWTLELLALEQGFHWIEHKEIERMSSSNEEMLAALEKQDCLGAVKADTDFHHVIVLASKNLELEQIINTTKQKLKRIDLHYFEKNMEGQESYKEHKKIISALKKHDLKEALKALETNWKASFARIKFN